jgi:RNA polymerase sigma factor (sigma-70 family)
MVHMGESRPGRPRGGGGAGRFSTTQWTIVLAAGHGCAAEAERAIATLCERYWYPVYAFVRREGSDADEALDVTQGFFAKLLERRDLSAVERGRGRFRSWLLTAVKHYAANERERARADKRGGGRSPLSIDLLDAESRYRLEPAHDETPERVFERRWAMMLLERALSALRGECRRDGKGPLFEALKEHIGSAPSQGQYQQSAAELGMTEGAVRTAVYRLRRRYRELLREQIAETVETPEQIEEEITFLLTALR